MPTTQRLKVRHCVNCGDEFTTMYEATYCPAHRGSASHTDFVDPPAVASPLTEPYAAVCMMCGRQQHEFQLTASGVRRAMLVCFPQCTTCGGYVALEPVLLTCGSSPDPQTPAVIRSGRLTPIPRRGRLSA